MALTPPNYRERPRRFCAIERKTFAHRGHEFRRRCGRGNHRRDRLAGIAHGVDALGVAVDKDGSIYFGSGTASFTGAYLVDKEGKSHYDLKDERGTIMKVSPDFKTSRNRLHGNPVIRSAMAFNANGDLFCTDQEGATWLPNGNPFDELLHIERGQTLRISAASSETSAERDRRTERVRLRAAAPIHVRFEFQ